MPTDTEKNASKPKKTEAGTRKPTKAPDEWRKDLADGADAVAQVVLSLARMKGDFFSVEETLCRSEIDGATRCFVVTTMSSDDPDEPGIENKRLSPMRCAALLWGMACYAAYEYVDESGEPLAKMRAQMTLIGADGSELNDAAASRKVINVALASGEVPWMSDDESDLEGSSLATRNRQLTNQNLRVMARLERMMDKRESQVAVIVDNAELMNKAGSRIFENRLEAADQLAKAVTDGAAESAWQHRLDDYGEKVGAIVLPKLDAWLESLVAKNNAEAQAASGAPPPKPGADVQPPPTFYVWCAATYGQEYLAEVVGDLGQAPTADGDERRAFWTAVLERIGEICEADEKPLPPDDCKAWARELSKTLTLNAPAWAAEADTA
ncbi:MAG: hypothetical protein V3V08_23205 [Nannocystaceae bacterium]